jgi:hypothetical protein
MNRLATPVKTLCFSSLPIAGQVAYGDHAITGNGNVPFNPWGAGAVDQVRWGMMKSQSGHCAAAKVGKSSNIESTQR